jgi:hypothetical protein
LDYRAPAHFPPLSCAATQNPNAGIRQAPNKLHGPKLCTLIRLLRSRAGIYIEAAVGAAKDVNVELGAPNFCIAKIWWGGGNHIVTLSICQVVIFSVQKLGGTRKVAPTPILSLTFLPT